MLVHPPMLLLGYMSFSVPFAFAIAALITGELDSGWLRSIRRWTLAAWTIQTTGLLLGAWWAYHVLGWGGYWGWDPVENAALLPWLTATAFLHSTMVQERRGTLKVWNLALIIATFALCIFGTFEVRSGIISRCIRSPTRPSAPFFLGFLAVVLRRLDRPVRLPPAAPAPGARVRLGRLARGQLPAQQPAADRHRLRDLLGHALPAALVVRPRADDDGWAPISTSR